MLIRHAPRIFPNTETPLLDKHLPVRTSSDMPMAIQLLRATTTTITESIFHTTDIPEAKKKLRSPHLKMQEIPIQCDR